MFVAADGVQQSDREAFERKIYVIRRLAEKRIADALGDRAFFYVPSFSSRTIVYTGMLISRQIRLPSRTPPISRIRMTPSMMKTEQG